MAAAPSSPPPPPSSPPQQRPSPPPPLSCSSALLPDNNNNNTSSNTVLCHHCLTPSPYPLRHPCPRGHCRGSVRYCSESCRDADCGYGESGYDGGGGGGEGGVQHSVYRCRFVGALRSSSSAAAASAAPVQINVDGESFPEYERVPPLPSSLSSSGPGSESDGGCGSAEAAAAAIDDDGGMHGPMPSFPPPFEPTGANVTCRLGDPCTVVLLPHQIDAGGSVLIRLHADSATAGTCGNVPDHPSRSVPPPRYALVDLQALTTQTPSSVDSRNSSPPITTESDVLWLRGAAAWYNHQDYFGAVRYFEDSLELIDWSDEEEAAAATEALMDARRRDTCSDEGAEEETEAFHAMMLCPPPIRGSNSNKRRTELSSRAHFLGACLLDADRIDEGRKWLMRSLRTVPPPGLDVDPSRFDEDDDDDDVKSDGGIGRSKLAVRQNAAATELALSYEEAGNVHMARAVASVTIDLGIGAWENAYQRPGYLYRGPAGAAPVGEGEGGAEEEEGKDDDGWWGRPYYPREDADHFPGWCRELEGHYPTIMEEFTSIVRRRRRRGHRSGDAGGGGEGCGKVIKNQGRADDDKGGAGATTDADADAEAEAIRHPLHWPQVGSGRHRQSGHDDGRVVSAGGDWREVVLFGSGSATNGGSDAAANLDAPKTRSLVRRLVPDAVSLAEAGGGEVIFSVLAPRTRIAPHCAGTNVRLTAHLGLVVPPEEEGKEEKEKEEEDGRRRSRRRPKCGIRVGGTWHSWTPGRILVFDDSYEHEVTNDTDHVRAVLLLRFWHPSVFVEDRGAVLAEMVGMKEVEGRWRYNPPLGAVGGPPSSSSSSSAAAAGLERERAERRGMGWTSCPRCLRTGHESVRVVMGCGVTSSSSSSWGDGGLGGDAYACACGSRI